MSLLVTLLLLVLIGKTSAIWVDGSEDSSFSNLGLHTMYMTCDDAGSVCQACFTSRSHGEAHLHVIEYTMEPYKLEYTTQLGDFDDKFIIFQEEPGDAYRVCTEMVVGGSNMSVWKLNICMDNALRGATIPNNCVRPIALVSLRAERNPDRLRGHELLLCAA
ncbi:uncharacterized protein LOC119733332 [Patiria miniata]|uniref:Uncharacterized protein n=1 Tax=Patiria miniata TaxID=46514 RepID=A0A914AHJ1_PATMI|nr:uncharacterized protein LOC119733332 [Patiria miniata]